MYGLVNYAVQRFLIETYGVDLWDAVRKDAGLEFEGFEFLMPYPPVLTERVLLASAFRLDATPKGVLENVGTWIVANPEQGSIRRLLRFGGGDFREFLMSLDEMPERIKMALPLLNIPEIHLSVDSATEVQIRLSWTDVDLSGLVLGALRAMADEYGALVLIESEEPEKLTSVIRVELLDNAFSAGRAFELGAQAT